jgi:hypothetical protein
VQAEELLETAVHLLLGIGADSTSELYDKLRQMTRGLQLQVRVIAVRLVIPWDSQHGTSLHFSLKRLCALSFWALLVSCSIHAADSSSSDHVLARPAAGNLAQPGVLQPAGSQSACKRCLCAAPDMGWLRTDTHCPIALLALPRTFSVPQGDLLTWLLSAVFAHDHAISHAALSRMRTRDGLRLATLELQERAMALHLHIPYKFTLSRNRACVDVRASWAAIIAQVEKVSCHMTCME